MLGTLISQVVAPLVIMLVGLYGLRKAQRKGAAIVIGMMALVAFGIIVPVLVLYTHLNKPKWCEQIYAANPRASSRPHDIFMSACQHGSYTAIHCLMSDYAAEHPQNCAKYRDETSAIVAAP